jgi:hypothetical protein
LCFERRFDDAEKVGFNENANINEYRDCPWSWAKSLLISLKTVRRTHRPRTNMHMSGLWRFVTNFDGLHPGVLDHFLDLVPVLRIWLKHLAKEWPTSSGIKVINCRGTSRDCRVLVCTCRGVGLVKRVCARLSSPPRKFREVKTVVNNPACPDVDQSRIIGYQGQAAFQKSPDC